MITVTWQVSYNGDTMAIEKSVLDQNPELSRLSPSILQILQMNKLCTLATIDSDGSPYVNTAYYAWDSELNIYMLTPPSTHHSLNVADNAAVAICIFDSTQRWAERHRGLQLIGKCQQARGAEEDKAFSVYSKRHVELLGIVQTPERLRIKLESRFYIAELDWIKVIDELTYGPETEFTVRLAGT